MDAHGSDSLTMNGLRWEANAGGAPRGGSPGHLDDRDAIAATSGGASGSHLRTPALSDEVSDGCARLHGSCGGCRTACGGLASGQGLTRFGCTNRRAPPSGPRPADAADGRRKGSRPGWPSRHRSPASDPVFGYLAAVASGLVPVRPGVPQGGEGGRVAPGLGEKVSTEPETVGMTGQVQMTEFRLGVELQGGGNHPVQMRREGSSLEVLKRRDAPAEARVLTRGLRGVLGDIGRHLGGPLVAMSEYLDVHLLAPAGRPSCVGHRHRAGSRCTHLGQLLDSDGWGGALGPVRPYDGVEVDDAPSLELCHPTEGETYAPRRHGLAEPEGRSQLAGEIDRCATPQFGRAGIVQHGAGVVIAIRAERRADRLVARPMALRAHVGAFVDATTPVPPAVTIASGPDGVHGAKAGCGQGDKDCRISGNRFGDALSTLETRPHQMASIAPVDLGASRAAHLAA